MKKLIAVCLGLLLTLPLAAAQAPRTALQQAITLFEEVYCKGPNTEAYPIGSAYPIAEHFLFTAKHVACPDGQKTLLSKDQGENFIEVKEQFPHPGLDLRALVVSEAFADVASFREARLGESVTGYGAALDVIATFGRVMKLIPDQALIIASNAPIGGMSGSALVADDGSVVGMTIWGYKDERVGGAVTGAISGSALKELASSFASYYAAQQEQLNSTPQPTEGAEEQPH